VTADGTVGLFRVEVSVSNGAGKLKPAGGVAGTIKKSLVLDVSDLHVEVSTC
jgi:ATP-dependent Lon protease